MKPVVIALSACILTLALPAAAFAAVPENDLPPGIEVTALPFTHSTDTELAEIHAMEPSSTCAGGGNSVWYHFTAAADQLLVVDTLGSDFDTVIDVFEGSLSATPDDPFDALTVVGCNDNHGASLQSRLTFAVTTGETYLIRVNNPSNGTGGSLTLNLAAAGAEEAPAPGETPAPVPTPPATDRSGSAAQLEGGPPSLALASLVAGLLAFGLVAHLRRRSSEARPRR